MNKFESIFYKYTKMRDEDEKLTASFFKDLESISIEEVKDYYKSNNKFSKYKNKKWNDSFEEFLTNEILNDKTNILNSDLT